MICFMYHHQKISHKTTTRKSLTNMSLTANKNLALNDRVIVYKLALETGIIHLAG